MRVLVTGGAGFIGSHVVEKLLEQGFEVRVLDLNESSFDGSVETFRGSVIECDVFERAIVGCDAVIHLAAVADVDQVIRNPARAESVNARGTLNALEAARHAGVKRVVYASTTWVYSDCDEVLVDEETVPAAPSHLYTSTKLAGEMYCKAYGKLYGLEFTILRFGIPYGPRARDGGVIRAFVERALAGEPLILAGSGHQSRRFVYVKDLAEGIVSALQPAAANRVYNLAGAESVSVLEVAETVRSILGAGEIVHAQPRLGDFPGKEISTRRAEEELGWTASTPLAEGVRRYVEWYEAERDEQKISTPRRVLILSADIGEGHNLPAGVVAADLEAESPGIEVAIEDCLAAMGRLVQFLVRDNSRVMFRWMPWLYGIQYFLLTRFAPTRWLAVWLTRLVGSRAILRLVEAYDPDAIVSTYPGATALIGELRRRRRLTVPTFSAITDLAGLHFWAHPGVDLHFVTHPESIEEVERIAGPDSVEWARPPTSPAFLVHQSRASARKTLGLPSQGNVVVVSGGGWGVGNLKGAIRASLAVNDTTVVCVCGHNDDLRRRLAGHFANESRVRLLGFTDQMGDLLASADALVHSTAGLTVLEAIIRGCPVVSFGFTAGHVRVNNKAFHRFDLASTAGSEAELTSVLHRILKARNTPDLRFARLPSAASFVLRNHARVKPFPVWRLRLSRGLATAATALLAFTAVFASNDSYTLFAKALDLSPTTSISTSESQVALMVDAPAPIVPDLARQLSAQHLHASFALNRSTPPQTIATLKQFGDEPIPKLAPGGPVRWLGTAGQLKRTARDLGLARHFFYATPEKGFTLGQYVLGHIDGATPVAAVARFAGEDSPRGVDRGDVVELTAGQSRPQLELAMRSLAGELHDRRLEAVPVTALARAR